MYEKKRRGSIRTRVLTETTAGREKRTFLTHVVTISAVICLYKGMNQRSLMIKVYRLATRPDCVPL